MIKSMTILGGGTSGLVTALILNKWYPTMGITIVESSTIGIVGVGEGSTEHWKTFMDTVGINVKELVLETGATFKSGIKFENWNGDGKSYMHSLHIDHTQMMANGQAGVLLKMICDGETQLYPDNIAKSMHHYPLDQQVNQFHFDTFKLNEFLHKKCKERGVVIVDDDIQDVEIDNEGYVSNLVSIHGKKYTSEFFVDCSGFARVISSKLGAKWIDCKEYLPMDRAIAFPTETTAEIPSHTLSRALSSGWNWRIPTQDRYGNGYVYSSEFLTDDQAVEEIQQYYDKEIKIGKSFKFSAGYVDKFWIKNCVSLGLAGSFVEPLEATSIGTSIQQAFMLGGSIVNWTRGDELIRDVYNKAFESVAKNIIDFVQIHYITKRNDTEFWRSCKHLKLTDFNQQTFEHFKNVLPNKSYFSNTNWVLFSELNWIQVIAGLEQFDLDKLRAIWHAQHPGVIKETEEMLVKMKIFYRDVLTFSHRDALEFLKKEIKVV
jgi:tryptophan halogenase